MIKATVLHSLAQANNFSCSIDRDHSQFDLRAVRFFGLASIIGKLRKANVPIGLSYSKAELPRRSLVGTIGTTRSGAN
jgi:hypothetical protein